MISQVRYSPPLRKLMRLSPCSPCRKGWLWRESWALFPPIRRFNFILRASDKSLHLLTVNRCRIIDFPPPPAQKASRSKLCYPPYMHSEKQCSLEYLCPVRWNPRQEFVRDALDLKTWQPSEPQSRFLLIQSARRRVFDTRSYAVKWSPWATFDDSSEKEWEWRDAWWRFRSFNPRLIVPQPFLLVCLLCR